MNWPPTNTDMLRELGRIGRIWTTFIVAQGFPTAGVVVFDPTFVAPLVATGLAEPVKGIRPSAAVDITAKGREALALLDGSIATSQYAQPDWLLEALSK